MVAVPAEAAQAVTDELVKAGVRGILNYAPINLTGARARARAIYRSGGASAAHYLLRLSPAPE